MKDVRYIIPPYETITRWWSTPLRKWGLFNHFVSSLGAPNEIIFSAFDAYIPLNHVQACGHIRKYKQQL